VADPDREILKLSVADEWLNAPLITTELKFKGVPVDVLCISPINFP
jgi:hypothetical protein